MEAESAFDRSQNADRTDHDRHSNFSVSKCFNELIMPDYGKAPCDDHSGCAENPNSLYNYFVLLPTK